MIDSLLSTGVQGIQSGLNRAQQAAEDIASATTAPTVEDSATVASTTDVTQNIAEAAVDLKIGERQVQASAAVVKTADEVLGTLVNTEA